MKKIFIILIYFLTSCGYQPMYVNNSYNEVSFKEIKLLGDKRINRQVMSALLIKEDQYNDILNSLTLNSEEIISETSKDAKGQVTTYRTTIILKYIVTNNNKIISEKIFNKDFSYNKKDNKFDLVEYQKEIKTSLVNEIIEELIIFINLNDN
tara:strand:+ start:2423 stop:2878 length:456 start_codon:yes stop_codon:yes gene_type:complete